MKRLKWVACILLLAVAGYFGAVGVVWLTRPTPGLTEENARLLRRGMTLQEVNALFSSVGILTEKAERFYVWHGTDTKRILLVQLNFDEYDRLIRAHLASFDRGFHSYPISIDKSLLDTIRGWFRL
ncbi:MAG: hypothetical protein HY040_01465 [Planctomycetes bacterium]|nr:hypothetical protein [Planctomycetota bacterium]